MKLSYSVFTALLSTTALIGFSNTAYAQDQENDEIIVTATKRAQSIQDVPIAVTAVNQLQLDRQGVTDIKNLENVSASFNLSSSQTETGGTTFRLRGVGTTGNNIGLESSVGVFVDGVFLSRPAVALGDLVDLQQIEILRGPQGTLFGRNTSAGALNVSTRKPDLTQADAFLNFGLGNFNARNLQAGFSVPVIEDELAIRVSGAYRERDGFVESTTGAESNNRERYLIRAQALWEPSDDFNLRIIGDYAESNALCCDAVIIRETPFVGLGVFGAAGLPVNAGVTASGPASLADEGANLAALDARTSNASQFTNPNDQIGISAEANWNIGDTTLTYVGSFRDFDAFSFQDSDFTAIDIFSAEITTNIENITQELRWQGKALGDRLDWLVGAYYSDETIEENQTFRLGDSFLGLIDGNGIAAITGALGANPFGTSPFSAFTGAPAQFDGNFASNDFRQDGNSFSIFTHNVFSVTDKLDLTVGVRYVDESKDGSFVQPEASSTGCLGIVGAPGVGGIANGNVPAPLIPLAVGLGCFPFVVQADLPFAQGIAPAASPLQLPLPLTFDETFEDEELIYTIKASYKFTPDISGYAGFTHGFKSGGFNLDPTAASGGASPQFDSEEIDAFEIGVKAELFDGRVTANIAGFHQILDDFQVLEFTGAQFTTFNVPRALSTGAEIELLAELTENLTVNASGTYTDARYPDDCDDGADPALAITVRVSSLCGLDLTNASDFGGILGATWEAEYADGKGYFLNASLRYESDRRTSTQGRIVPGAADVAAAGSIQAAVDAAPLNPLDVQDSNVKVNLRAGVDLTENISAEVFGTNIFDEQTRAITFNVPLRGLGTSNARGAFLQEPRFWGATMRIKY